MNYFSLIFLICIFQSIRLSLACYGYGVEMVDSEGDPRNNLKFIGNVTFDLTDDCLLTANASMTVDRPFNSALVSIKTQSNSIDMDMFTIDNRDFRTFLSDFDITGLECTSIVQGRHEVTGKKDISEYGPYLGFMAGQFTVIFRVCYDGNENNPDVISVTINIKQKNDEPAWIF